MTTHNACNFPGPGDLWNADDLERYYGGDFTGDEGGGDEPLTAEDHRIAAIDLSDPRFDDIEDDWED